MSYARVASSPIRIVGALNTDHEGGLTAVSGGGRYSGVDGSRRAVRPRHTHLSQSGIIRTANSAAANAIQFMHSTSGREAVSDRSRRRVHGVSGRHSHSPSGDEGATPYFSFHS